MLTIGIAGPAGSGKTTLANALVGLLGADVVPFAAPLKKFCVSVLGLRPSQVYGDEKDTPTKCRRYHVPDAETHDRFLPDLRLLTAREVMQLWGTEVFRRVDPDIWVERWRERVAAYAEIERAVDIGIELGEGWVARMAGPPKRTVIADDLRFPNEHAAVDVRIRLVGGTPDGHESENALAGLPFDLTLDTRASGVAAAAAEVADMLTARRAAELKRTGAA